MKDEGAAAKEAGFLLQQLQDSSARAMATISNGTAPRTRSVRQHRTTGAASHTSCKTQKHCDNSN